MSSKLVDAYVGMRLKKRRMELGLSQNKIGELTGITFQQIQKYEKGLNRIGSGRLYELATILKVPVSYFFEGYDEYSAENDSKGSLSDNKSQFVYSTIEDKEMTQLVKYFIKIDDPVLRKSVINLTKSLSKKCEEEFCSEENSDE